MMKNELKYKGYSGSAEVSVEDDCLHGRILFIDDLITYEAESIPELKVEFQGAVERYLAYCEQIGKLASKPYSGSFNVRIGPDRHKALSQHAARNGITLNEAVGLACDLLLRKSPSEKVVNNHFHIHPGHEGALHTHVTESIPFVLENQQWTQDASWVQ